MTISLVCPKCSSDLEPREKSYHCLGAECTHYQKIRDIQVMDPDDVENQGSLINVSDVSTHHDLYLDSNESTKRVIIGTLIEVGGLMRENYQARDRARVGQLGTDIYWPTVVIMGQYGGVLCAPVSTAVTVVV